MNKNYDTVKNFLFKKVIQENIETLIPKIEEAVSLSIKEINSALNELNEEKEIVLTDSMVYVVDDIHYKIGELRVIRGQFAFVGEGDSAVYVGRDDFGDAIDQDEVLVHVEHAKESSGKVIKVLSRTKTYILGTIVKGKRGLEFESYDRKITPLINFDAKGEKVKVGQRLIGRIVKMDRGILYLELESILGMVDEPGIDVLSVLYSHDLETTFNSEVLQEAKRVPTEVVEKEVEGRIDHRDQYAITIDGEDAKDLDDAVYLEPLNGGYRLYVHIADVSYYVHAGSAIDQTAQARTSSIYMVDRVVPMLPKELSNGVCSLHPDVDRLTMTCKMDMDSKGNIYNYEVYPSVIRSKRRMSYNEVNDSDDLGEVTEMIEMMLECARILHEKRDAKGSINFDSDESQFIVDANGKVLDIIPREQREAEKMIEAFMVSANECVAKYTKHLDIPAVYRVHEKPDLDKMKALSHMLLILGYRLKGNLGEIHPHSLQKALEHFEGSDSMGVVSRLMLRSMKKARYDIQTLGHFGLALEDYAHFTAPIRRYSDLVLHRSLRNYVFDHDYSHYDEDGKRMQEDADHISSKERDIMEAEREVEKMKKAEFMEDKVGERYTGIVSGFSNYGMYVELPNTVEGVIPLKSMRDDFYNFNQATQKLIGERTKNTYTLGQKVEVQVEGIDALESDVIFKLIFKRRVRKPIIEKRLGGKRGKNRDFKRRKK